MAEKWDAPAAVPADATTPAVAKPVLSKVPTTKKLKPAKNSGRVAVGEKLAERNRVAREAKKNQKTPEAPDEGKRRQKTQVAESTAICFLA